MLASGLIAGGSLGGVLIAFMNIVPGLTESIDLTKPTAALFGGKPDSPALAQMVLGAVLFAALGLTLLLAGMGKLFKPERDIQ